MMVEEALNRLRGDSHRGKYEDKASLEKKLEIIFKDYPNMKELFRIHIIEADGKFHLEYETIKSKMKELRAGFAKTLIFTNSPRFTEQNMVEAYFGKSDIENQFREMKNPNHIAVKPIRHFTDNMIRVHIFSCVIALLLRNLLITKIQRAKIDIEKIDLFKHLEEIKEVMLLYPPPNPPMRELTELDETKRKLFDILELDKLNQDTPHYVRQRVQGVKGSRVTSSLGNQSMRFRILSTSFPEAKIFSLCFSSTYPKSRANIN